MTLQLHDRYGLVPSSAGDGSPFTLIACHDTEGGAGAQGAWNTLAWMAATATQRNASYHELWGWDRPVLTIIRCVPAHRAAHSIAPQPVSPGSGLPLYQPDAYVAGALAAGGNRGDPNQGSYAVAIAGSVATMAAYAKDPAFLAAARRRFEQLAQLTGTRRRAEHFRYNPRTRSDWGRVLMAALGGLTIPDEEDVPMFDDVKPPRTDRAAVEWAARERLLVGTGPRRFDPDKPLTRAQAAVVMERFARWLDRSDG